MARPTVKIGGLDFPVEAEVFNELQRITERCAALLEYVEATQFWKIEPHDQKERNAFLRRLGV